MRIGTWSANLGDTLGELDGTGIASGTTPGSQLEAATMANGRGDGFGVGLAVGLGVGGTAVLVGLGEAARGELDGGTLPLASPGWPPVELRTRGVEPPGVTSADPHAASKAATVNRAAAYAVA